MDFISPLQSNRYLVSHVKCHAHSQPSRMAQPWLLNSMNALLLA